MRTGPPPVGADRRPLHGLTLADCGLIVLGAALVLALPTPGEWALLDSQDAALRWLGRLSIAWHAIGRAALALLIVAVTRAARAERPIRPAELLLAILAGPILSRVVDESTWIGESTVSVPIRGRPNAAHRLFPGAPFWWTHAAIVAAGVGAAVALLLVRRRLPALATSLLLVVIALSAAWVSAPSADIMSAWTTLRNPVPPAAERTVGVIQRAISGLITAMVAVLALHELLCRQRPLGSFEWIGLSLLSASFLLSVTSPLVYLGMNGTAMAWAIDHALYAVVGQLVAIMLGVLLLGVSRRLFDPLAMMTQPSTPFTESSQRTPPPSGA